jgi:hypothetical protein
VPLGKFRSVEPCPELEPRKRSRAKFVAHARSIATRFSTQAITSSSGRRS